MLVHVKPQNIALAWPQFGEMLRRAIEAGRGECSTENLRRLLEQGRAELLIQSEGRYAVALEFQDYPNARIAHVIACGGRGVFADSRELAQFRAWCRARGCASVQCFARGAAARLWRRCGLEQRYEVLGMKL